MFAFFQCVAESVAENGARGLLEMVPGGAFALAVAGGALAKYKARKHDEALRDEVARIASAGVTEARQAAVEAVKEVADRVPIEDRVVLESFLAQIPSAISQSLKRPADPSGKTVPASFALTTADDVLRLLPPRPPRFKAGDALPGHAEWRLERVLGVGGFGEVWLARHTDMGLESAVKFCHGPQAADLRHESQVIAQVMRAGEHPSVVALRDAVLTGSTPWLRFDFVDGGDLGDVARSLQRQPTEQRAKHVINAMRQIALAVGTFHRLNPAVVHRDLKPSNILYDKTARKLRVTDFGIGAVTAKATLADEARGAATSSGRMLSSHRGSHTPLYASPQQRAGSDPDPRDDVHALGVITYQMLTGHLTQGPGTDYAHDMKDAGSPPGLIDLVGRCVAQNPNRRPATAAEMARELAALGTQPPNPGPTVPPAVVEPTPKPDPVAIIPPVVPLPPSPPLVPSPPVSPPATSDDWGKNVSPVPLIFDPPPEHDVDLPISGSWKMNRVENPYSRWKQVSKLPATVKVRPGDEVYRLDIARGARDANIRGITNLIGIEELHTLDLIKCKRLTEEGFALAAKLTQLHTLFLSESSITDMSLKLFAKLPQLEVLELIRTGITDAGLACLKSLKSLTFLSLDGTPLTDAGLLNLMSLRQLVDLDIESTQITDAGLASVAGLSKLEFLRLSDTRVTDEGVGHLLQLSRLRVLQLDRTGLTDIGIAQLATMKKLELLWVAQCGGVTDRGLSFLGKMKNLEALDVSKTAVTDAGIAFLKGMPKMTTLYLGDCVGITDAGVEHLVSMPRLGEVDLTGTSVTTAGLARLRDALPDCRVGSGLEEESEDGADEETDDPDTVQDGEHP
ncbi:MAG: hypothetical protein C0467_27865 [Planctomycetaceae bacterium]|nr:hypothetical protein [Planctomycetaceae bacterium]